MPESQRRRFRVRAAFFAAAERERAERCPATRFACLDNACLDAERRLSRLSARFVARERFRDGFLRAPARPFARSRFAWRFVRSLPRFGGGNFTPARRAFGQTNGDRLLWRSGAVFAFADVFHFFAHKFARLSGRRLAFAIIFPRAFNYFFFWHNKIDYAFSRAFGRI